MISTWDNSHRQSIDNSFANLKWRLFLPALFSVVLCICIQGCDPVDGSLLGLPVDPTPKIDGKIDAPSRKFLGVPISKIAIIVRKEDYLAREYDREIEDIFISQATRKGYRVASRSDIESITKEMEFERSSGLTDSDIAAIGRILNVSAIMVVSINHYDFGVHNSRISIGARLISVERAEILWINTAEGSANYRYSNGALLASYVAKLLAEDIPNNSGY